MKTFISFLFLSIFGNLLSQVDKFNIETSKYEVLDVYDNVTYSSDTCKVDISLEDKRLVLQNLSTKQNREYLLDSLFEYDETSTAWTCKNYDKEKVLLFYLQKKTEFDYIFYIFFENLTYKYYCYKD